MSDSDLDSEWLEALEVEEAPVDDTPEEKPEDDKPVEDEVKDEEEADGEADSGDNDSDNDGEPDDAEPESKDAEETPQDKEEPEEKESTKEAIKEALQEIESAKEAKTSRLESLKKEVAETLYPEGIDRQLRDKDGDPITSISDLTKLLNPDTGELFTDEEAGAWLLSNQQRLNQDIETVEKFTDKVAEVNADVTDGAERVSKKYGHILAADDKLREQLIKGFDSTLIKDPKTGVTIDKTIDVMEFFDLALGPRLEQQAAAEQAAAAEAKAKAEQAAKDAQAERGDFSPKGQSENLDPDDKEWAEAIKSYEKGA